MCAFMFFFFKQKTAYEMRISDWSSDVCSSDLKLDPAQSLHPELVLLVLELHRGRTAMDFHPCKSSGGLPVNVHFKIRAPLLDAIRGDLRRSEEHTSELQSLMRISYAVFCLKKKISIYTETK